MRDMALRDRRRVPRLAVRSRSTLKVDGRLVPVELIDISPLGARIGMRDPTPAPGTPVKLYLRAGKPLEAVVVRATEGGFALEFAESEPTAMPCKTFFWKLESYVFSGAYAPNARAAHGRHLPTQALVDTCTVLAWDEWGARIDTAVRLALGTRVHLCGREMVVTEKHGTVFTLEPATVELSLEAAL
jgi:hypothetical protein